MSKDPKKDTRVHYDKHDDALKLRDDVLVSPEDLNRFDEIFNKAYPTKGDIDEYQRSANRIFVPSYDDPDVPIHSVFNVIEFLSRVDKEDQEFIINYAWRIATLNKITKRPNNKISVSYEKANDKEVEAVSNKLISENKEAFKKLAESDSKGIDMALLDKLINQLASDPKYLSILMLLVYETNLNTSMRVNTLSAAVETLSDIVDDLVEDDDDDEEDEDECDECCNDCDKFPFCRGDAKNVDDHRCIKVTPDTSIEEFFEVIRALFSDDSGK